MFGYIALFFATLLLGPAIFAGLSVYFAMRYIRSRELHLSFGTYMQDVYYRST
jgi:hypothetical protein